MFPTGGYVSTLYMFGVHRDDEALVFEIDLKHPHHEVK
jgi:hypothetical protein